MLFLFCRHVLEIHNQDRKPKRVDLYSLTGGPNKVGTTVLEKFLPSAKFNTPIRGLSIIFKNAPET